MITPEPFKRKCPKCGYSKIVKPKSDVLTPNDINALCPKCNIMMETQALNAVERIMSNIRLSF